MIELQATLMLEITRVLSEIESALIEGDADELNYLAEGFASVQARFILLGGLLWGSRSQTV